MGILDEVDILPYKLTANKPFIALLKILNAFINDKETFELFYLHFVAAVRLQGGKKETGHVTFSQ